MRQIASRHAHYYLLDVNVRIFWFGFKMGLHKKLPFANGGSLLQKLWPGYQMLESIDVVALGPLMSKWLILLPLACWNVRGGRGGGRLVFPPRKKHPTNAPAWPKIYSILMEMACFQNSWTGCNVYFTQRGKILKQWPDSTFIDSLYLHLSGLLLAHLNRDWIQLEFCTWNTIMGQEHLLEELGNEPPL